MESESENTRLTSAAADQYSGASAGSANQPAFSHEVNDGLAQEEGKCSRWWPIPKRYIVAFLAFLGFGEKTDCVWDKTVY